MLAVALVWREVTGMKSCREVHRLVIEAQDRKLGFAERLSMRVHLILCATCRRFDAQMDLLRQALRRFPGD
ncbi:MAG: zf-HC2 domain-containing protein [Propionivibrio sp.]|nr:zf-HC2 domain-containing protein [Propionivibrio sp.]